MTRRLMGLAVAAAAASAFVLPAAPAHASCEGTFVFNCIRELLEPPPASNDSEICVFEDDTTGTYICV